LGSPHGCVVAFSWKERGIQVLAGLAPSSQTVRALFRAPWLALPVEKVRQKVILVNSLQFKIIL